MQNTETVSPNAKQATLVHKATIALAKDHKSMRVDYSGLLSEAGKIIRESDPGYAEMLRQLEGHLQELGKRYYSGDIAVVDEFLQLYCIESEAREALKQEQEAQYPE